MSQQGLRILVNLHYAHLKDFNTFFKGEYSFDRS